VVLGLGRDKDAEGILKALAPLAERVICTSVGTALHRTSEELAHRARDLGIAAEESVPPRAALDRSLAAARGRAPDCHRSRDRRRSFSA
jgi:folylpolyglutamate synthase/dihydropteroate synthase